MPPIMALIKNKLSKLFNGNGKTSKDMKSPIQNEEHSIHNNILRKKWGKVFATKFLIGIKISDNDHK